MTLRTRPMLSLVLAGALVAVLAAVCARPVAAAPGRREASPRRTARSVEEVAPGRYIVLYHRSVAGPTAETKARERRDGFRARRVYRRAVKGFAANLSPGQVQRLQADPEVASVTPDRKVAATEALADGEPQPPEGIRRIGAATATSVRGGSGVRVAVIDTGIDLHHGDLNAESGTNCVSPGSTADDDNGHGTHVAGTIAARNDGRGVVGVAPGTRVVAAKVLDASGSGYESDVICGIDWVTSTRTDDDPSNDVAVANMSLGGLGSPVEPCATTTDPEHKAICNSTAAGVTYVVAAGNEGWDFDFAREPDVPAAYPEALTVAAMADSDGAAGGSGGSTSCDIAEPDDRYASFSNYALTAAGEAHTIAAPGVCVRSTWPGGGYATESGTSMATPHVAGAVALCIDEAGTAGPCAGLSPDQIVEKMRIEAQSRASAEPGYGFEGDPGHPTQDSPYFGYLTWAGTREADATPPTVTSVSPADGQVGLARGTTVSVAFSEPMNPAATENAFSLVRASDGARVAGSFSWSGDTMTFHPAAPLDQGASYRATVGTGAKDAAANPLASSRTWSFKTLATVNGSPTSTVIESGTLRGGSYARLGADDNSFYEVNSTAGATRTVSWYGRIGGVSNALKSLKLTYRGKSSATCSQALSLWRWTTNSWIVVDSRSVGTGEVQVDRSPPGAPADYVSGTTGNGEVRARVRCTRTASSFFTQGDLMRITYDRP